MEAHGKSAETPLLGSSHRGTASSIQTLGNILVSIVGTGVLGLPFAFRVAGWLAGTVGVIVTGLSTCYCMLILVQCRKRLVCGEEKTYGDLGYSCLGKPGRYLTEFLIFISYCGGSVAYLKFIGQTLASVFSGMTFTSFIFCLVPIEIMLSWIRTLSALSPFTIFADVCNVAAIAMVVKEDVQVLWGSGSDIGERRALSPTIAGLPFGAGVAVFCFEGFGMTLALEGSMRERGAFTRVLIQAFCGLTTVYVLFGLIGYLAYGDQTLDIATLNLPQGWSSMVVQLGLCMGLVFTLPIMLHPLHEIIEVKLKESRWFQKYCYDGGDYLTRAGKLGMYVMRAVVVMMLALVASYVPAFGVFTSLVGSTVCALISFVLPTIFHLKISGSSLPTWQKALDVCILSCGFLFACYGTYNTIFGAPRDLGYIHT